MTAPTSTQQNGNQVRPGSMFAVPGITRWTYQQDNNYALTTVESSGGATGSVAVTPPLGIIPFYQTDVAFGWNIQLSVTQANNAGTTTITASPQAPYNFFNNLKLSVNKLYSPIDVYSDYDLHIYNTLRPMYGNNLRGSSQYFTAPAQFPVSPAASPFGTGFAFATAGPFYVPMEWPVSLWFDEYFDLDLDGNIKGVNHRLPVSPLYMSGEARVVTPYWQYAQVLSAGGSADLNPFHYGGTLTTLPTVLDTFNVNFNRVGIYSSNNLSTMPPVFAWRLALTSRQFAPVNYGQVKIPIRVALNPGSGQLLLLMVRFFDPAIGVYGGPTVLSTATLLTPPGGMIVTYGSGIIRAQDTYIDMRQRIMNQHDLILPEGIIAYDFAVDDRQRITNARALNMYLTDVFLQINFVTGQLPSASAYAIIFAETLTYVIDNVAAAVGVAAM
jgi:hypothetical protein